MIFSTHWFILFAGIAVTIHWLLPPGRWRLWTMALACGFFHAHFAGPAGVIPIIVLMILTYFAARSRRPWACTAAIVVCVTALCFYKYVLFLIGAVVEPWSATLAASLTTQTRALMPGAPPLAISFFTFEFVHYLYDVRKGGEPIRNPIRFLVFAIFFPSLVAGPIKRYQQFLPSLDEALAKRRLSLDELTSGLWQVAQGYAKKVIIADNLTWYIEHTQADFGQFGLWSRWVLVAAIAFRILLDFSGYSDIAIGCARLLGIALPANFNWPYLARDLREFWQRWHISLSSWLRDYVYIPLGGSRHGWFRRGVNGLVAFGLCGLWHGPAWHFVLWGLYHGLGLAVCTNYERVPAAGPLLRKLFVREPVAAWVVTQAYVWCGWLVFFYPARQAWQMGRGLFAL